MAKRYSQRRSDGTVVYYDSESEMYGDVPQRGLFEFSTFWAVIGFAVFLLAGSVAAYNLEAVANWPKWLRFASILAVAVVGGYVIGRLGQSLLILFWGAIALSILFALGSAVWHFA